MSNQADTAIVRARQYAYVDGLAEIATSAVFCLIGLLFTVDALAEPDSALSGASALGLPIVVLGGIWLGGRAVRMLKERLVYPRTGKVEYRRPPRGHGMLVAAVAAAVAVALVVVVAAFGSAGLRWMEFLTAAIVGLFFAYMGYELRITRFYLLAVVSAALGAGASWLAENELAGSAGYFWAMGACLFATGALTLGAYLRRDESPAEGTSSTGRAP